MSQKLILLKNGSSNNEIYNNTSGSFTSGMNSGIIDIDGSDSNNIHDNILSNNHYGGSAISLTGASSNTIASNTIQNGDDWGIYLTASSNSNTISNNLIQYNNSYGTYITGSSGNTLTGNTYLRNGYANYDDSSNTYTSNNFYFNASDTTLSFADQARTKNIGDTVNFSFTMKTPTGAAYSGSGFSVSTSPTESVTSNRSGNTVMGSFSPSKNGWYSLIFQLTDGSGNVTKRSYNFLVGSTASKTTRLYLNGISPTKSNVGNGHDTGALLFTAPATSQTTYCADWVTAAPDETMDYPFSNLSSVIFNSWYKTDSSNSPILRLQRYVKYKGAYEALSADNLNGATLSNSQSFKNNSTTISNINWTMDSGRAWNRMGINLLTYGRSPTWNASPGQSTYADFTYSYPSSVAVKSNSNDQLILLSATAPASDNSSSQLAFQNLTSSTASTTASLDNTKRPFQGATDTLINADGTANVNVSLGANATSTFSAVPLDIVPTGGSVDVTVNTWNASGDYHKNWTESSATHSTTTTHTVGNLNPNTYYTLTVDSSPIGTYQANAQGQITFNYTGGYSTHTFDLLSDATPPITTASPDQGTYNATQNVTLTCTDNTGGSGCSKTYYTTDGTTPTASSTQYATPIAISANTTLEFFSTDNAGNSETVNTKTYVIDSTPPTTTDNTDSNWHNSNVTIVLTCADGTGSGCSKTYYTTDGSTPTTSSTQGNSISLTSNGQYTIKYFSTDNAGNSETVKMATNQVKIDKTAPTTTDNTDSSWHTGSVTVTLTCTDNTGGSGCNKTYYTTDGTSPTTSSSQGNSITLSSDGQYTIKYFSTDNANNQESIETAAHQVKIDATVPVTTASPIGGTYGATQNLTLACSDSGSGCNKTYYTTDGSTSTTSSSQYSSPITVSSTTTLKFFSKDTAGNSETPSSQTYTIDSTYPVTTIDTSSEPANPTKTTSAAFTFSSNKTGSTFQCKLDGGSYSSCTSPKNYSSLSDGSHTFTVQATDTLGHVEPTPPTYTWVVDTTAPATTDNIDTNWYTNFTVILTCSDGTGSGCNKTYYTTDGTTPTTSSSHGNSITLAADGQYTIKYFSTDNAGNNETVKTAAHQVKIDKTSPISTATPGQGIYNATQNVILACSDGLGSGCSKTYYTTDGTTPTTLSSQYATPIAISANATLEFFSTDIAGNAESVSTKVYTIDTVAPAVTAPTVPAATNNPKPTITWLAANDSGSGVATYELQRKVTSANDSTFADVTGATALTTTTFTEQSNLPEGSYTYSIYATDHANNKSLASSNSAAMVVDTTHPVISGVTDSQTYYVTQNPTFNEGTATLNGNAYASGTDIAAAGDYTLTVTDAASNQTTVTFHIIKAITASDPTQIATDATNGAISGSGSDDTFNVDYTLTNPNLTVLIPQTTQMTLTSGTIDLSQFVSQLATATDLTSVDVLKAIKFGLPNMKLNFSQPITVSINVGDTYNTQLLTVYYQNEGETNWNQQGTCLVVNGICQFQTNHATTYAATKANAIVANTTTSSSHHHHHKTKHKKKKSAAQIFQSKLTPTQKWIKKTGQTFGRNLSPGSRGNDVGLLQTVLQKLGLLKVSQTTYGVYLSTTQNAVARLQSLTHIISSGVFGWITRGLFR